MFASQSGGKLRSGGPADAGYVGSPALKMKLFLSGKPVHKQLAHLVLSGLHMSRKKSVNEQSSSPPSDRIV